MESTKPENKLTLNDLIPEFPIAGKIKPFKHRLFVHILAAPDETKTDGGIFISRRAREAEIETTQLAVIVSVGPECHEDMQPGKWVMLPRFAGTPVIHDNTGSTGGDYRIVAEDSVMAFMDEEEVARKHQVSSN